ncbi:MAG TPA: peptide ABC transporter substrate-binding protein, partial [Ktedonobacterales bacterium]
MMRLGLRKLTLSGVVVLLGTVALLVSACGSPSSSNSAKAKSQVLHMAWGSGGGPDIPTLDPGEVSDAASIPIVNMVFDGLVVLDKNLKVVNWGADKVDVSADGTTYTFHLRSGQA